MGACWFLPILVGEFHDVWLDLHSPTLVHRLNTWGLNLAGSQGESLTADSAALEPGEVNPAGLLQVRTNALIRPTGRAVFYPTSPFIRSGQVLLDLPETLSES